MSSKAAQTRFEEGPCYLEIFKLPVVGSFDQMECETVTRVLSLLPYRVYLFQVLQLVQALDPPDAVVRYPEDSEIGV